MKITDRFEWAVDILEIKPNDHVLEIGCGTGLAVEKIVSKLSKGSITAIDQSKAMVAKASKRNKKFIESKKVILLNGKFSARMLSSDYQYDKIFAFNVSMFWKNPIAELKIIKEHLSSKGKFYLFYQPPPGKEDTRQIAEKASDELKEGGFQIKKTMFEKFASYTMFCIIAVPAD